jgi:predicted CoA-binding protein
MTPKQRIDDFLAQKRIAIAGVSRKQIDFTRVLFREFVRRGYDAVPVNPKAEGEIDGRPAFPTVRDIQPPVDAVLIATGPEHTGGILSDCASAGVKRVWLYKAIGQGSVSPGAAEFCAAHGIELVPGECPFMFFPNPGLHAIHGLFLKLVGRYPK